MAIGGSARQQVAKGAARPRRVRLRRACLASTALGSSLLAAGSLVLAIPAQANPEDGTVVAGSAVIGPSGGQQLDILQSSDRAVIDWRRFNIAPDEHTRFQQPSSSSVTLNRVTSADPSSIQGQLTANGQVFLVNPNGVVFGEGAQVDVGGLVVSTANISNDDLMAGRYRFDQPGSPDGRIENQGEIRIADRGLGALVAPEVANSGTITANLGQVVLAGAETFTLDPTGDGLVSFSVGQPVQQAPGDGAALVSNSGRIAGAHVTLTAAALDGVVDNAIDMSGVIEARSFAMEGGTIVLGGAGEGGLVRVTGTLDATGGPGAAGGRVEVLGDRVSLDGQARVDVSGDAGGGEVLIGGGYQGRGPQPNASRTYVGSGATIGADAFNLGDGGRVIIWADDATLFAGTITARGGAQGGNGGFVETSARGSLSIGGRVDAGAPRGVQGTWLLDPTNIVVAASGDPVGAGLFFGDGPANATVSAASISAAVADVVLQAENNITVDAAIDITGNTPGALFGNADLVFQAGNTITINAQIQTRGGNVHLEADSPHSTGLDGFGSIVINAPILTSGGDVTLIGSNFAIGDDVDTTGEAVDGRIAVALALDGDSLAFGGEEGLIDQDEVDHLRAGEFSGRAFGVAFTAGSDGQGTGSQRLEADSIFFTDSIDFGDVYTVVQADSVWQNEGTAITARHLGLVGNSVYLDGDNDVDLLTAAMPFFTEGGSVTFNDIDEFRISQGFDAEGFSLDGLTGAWFRLSAGGSVTQNPDTIVDVYSLEISAGGDVIFDAFEPGGEGYYAFNDTDLLAVYAPGQRVVFYDIDNVQIGQGGITSFALDDIDGIDAGSVHIQAGLGDFSGWGSDIVVSRPVNTTSNTVVLQASGDIYVDAPITATGGNVHLEADSPHIGGGSDGSGSIFIESSDDGPYGSITTNGGNVTLIGADFFIQGTTVDAGDGDIDVVQSPASGLLFLGPSGQLSPGELGALVTTGMLTLGAAQTAGPLGDFVGREALQSNRIVASDAMAFQVTGSLTFAAPTSFQGDTAVFAGGDVIFADAVEGPASLGIGTPGSVTFRGSIAGFSEGLPDLFNLFIGLGPGEGAAAALADSNFDSPETIEQLVSGTYTTAPVSSITFNGALVANGAVLLASGPIRDDGRAVDVNALLVDASAASMFGTVNGATGPQAAREARQVPNPENNLLLFNLCVIETGNACFLPPPVPPREPTGFDPPGLTNEPLILNPQPIFLPVGPADEEDDELLTNSGNEELWTQTGVGTP